MRESLRVFFGDTEARSFTPAFLSVFVSQWFKNVRLIPDQYTSEVFLDGFKTLGLYKRHLKSALSPMSIDFLFFGKNDDPNYYL